MTSAATPSSGHFDVVVSETGEVARCGVNESALQALARMGKRGVPVGCRGGGCGICKVRVVSGDYKKRVMSREHISLEQEAQSLVLACRIFPESDIEISVVGLLKKCMTRPPPD